MLLDHVIYESRLALGGASWKKSLTEPALRQTSPGNAP